MLADVPFTAGGLVKTMAIAAFSATVTYGIGEYARGIGNFYARTAFSAIVHGTFQGGMSAAQGGKFWSGFAAGSIASIAASFWEGGSSTIANADGTFTTIAHKGIGASIGMNSNFGTIAFGTVMGGAGSRLGGGNFWQGAVTGLIVSMMNHVMHQMTDKYDNPNPPKFRWRHLFGPDALYIAGTEDLGIGIGVGFEQGVIIVLRGKDVGVYPAQDFGIGLSTVSGTLALEVVKLYYSGDTVIKDVFFGNRYEVNFGADALGHIGFTGVYAPMKDGNVVWGYGATFGVGFSTTIFSGNINYGRTQINWDSLIPNLVRQK